VPQRGPPPLPSRKFKAVVPNLRSQPKSGLQVSGVGSQEGFVENSIIFKYTSSYLEANALPDRHLYEFLDLTSNINI
jgi:hypothetical protein